MPTFGSLFSGIGGIDLGLERAGWECKWQVEIDEFCQRVLTKHWPDVPKYRDVFEVHGHSAHEGWASTDAHNRCFQPKDKVQTGGQVAECSTCLPPVELIVGGFPCQPFSHAGRRTGSNDDRYLWPEMLRVIREVRPSLVLAENVFGLVTIEQGMVLETVYLDLEAEQYEVAPPFVFPAAALGAPHRRDRVWIVAYSGGTGGRRGCKPNDAGPQTSYRSSQADDTDPTGPGRFSWGAAGETLPRPETEQRPGRLCSVVPDTGSGGSQRSGPCRDACYSTPNGEGEATESFDGRLGSIWRVEPNVGRVANGVPSRVDRLKALGNAVVPQCAEYLGRVLMEMYE